MMKHKGYVAGPVEFDDEAGVFHGEVLGIRDVVTFQGRSVNELKKAFRESVDDYLEFCAERGEEPDRPFPGSFVVRLSPKLHRNIFITAKQAGKSVNAWVVDQLQSAIK